ncbi:MAG: hypothetical protein JXQ29_10725 [Planctomycetes bacterium]|nr:hypothetical protein [Planctomycetota bacterium]
MPLLADYAITPDVFDVTSYSHPDACDAELRNLKEVMLDEGLIRDLRAGEWRRLFMSDGRPWHRRGKELLKKLAQQNRLVPFPPTAGSSPPDDSAWCQEALGTHAIIPFTGGVIVREPVKAAFPDELLVARIDRLASARWWAARSPSVSLHRNVAEYLEQLAPVSRCANSLMFIDPHLDPARPGYRDFAQILAPAGRRTPAAAIEIHRVCYEGSGPGRVFPMRAEAGYFERRFRDALQASVRAVGLRVEVFVWDDFHDRHLISNLIGISLPNGFDTTADPSSVTRWTRLGREDRDDVQREFDPASNRHALRQRFVIQ